MLYRSVLDARHVSRCLFARRVERGRREREALQAQLPLACPNYAESHTSGSNHKQPDRKQATATQRQAGPGQPTRRTTRALQSLRDLTPSCRRNPEGRPNSNTREALPVPLTP
eukprot:353541-Chlamydomonas_euryale.AAC.2